MARETCARAPHARQASSSRIVVLLAVLATLAALLGITAASASAATAKPRSSSEPAVSAAHPFSDPEWLPLHNGFGVDCAGNNPGCTSDRSFFSIDMIPTGQYGPHAHKSHAKVYAMGGGIVHYGQAHGSRCGSGSRGGASFGTWVWIDHGAGVISRYGHLSKILVPNGAHVAAGTAIGRVGTTGKGHNCDVSYLDFMVEHNGLANNNSVHFDTLQACSTDGQEQTWPAQAASTKKPGDDDPVHFTKWDHVVHTTQFPASSGSCIPAGLPATTAAPSSVKVTKPGKSHLTVWWSRPAVGTTHVMVELSIYHPSEHSWARSHNEVWRSVSATASHVSVSGLKAHHLYRARVSFVGAAGASRGSSWVEHHD